MDAAALIGFFMVLVLLVVGASFFLWLIPVQLWIAAWSSGSYVGMMTLIAMRLRRVAPAGVVNPRITATEPRPSSTPSALACRFALRISQRVPTTRVS